MGDVGLRTGSRERAQGELSVTPELLLDDGIQEPDDKLWSQLMEFRAVIDDLGDVRKSAVVEGFRTTQHPPLADNICQVSEIYIVE